MNTQRIRELQLTVAALTVEALQSEFDFLVQMRATFDQRLQEVREQLKALRVRSPLPAGRVSPLSHPGTSGATRDKLVAAFNGHDVLETKELISAGVRSQYLYYASKKGIIKRVRQGAYQLVRKK